MFKHCKNYPVLTCKTISRDLNPSFFFTYMKDPRLDVGHLAPPAHPLSASAASDLWHQKASTNPQNTLGMTLPWGGNWDHSTSLLKPPSNQLCVPPSPAAPFPLQLGSAALTEATGEVW